MKKMPWALCFLIASAISVKSQYVVDRGGLYREKVRLEKDIPTVENQQKLILLLANFYDTYDPDYQRDTAKIYVTKALALARKIGWKKGETLGLIRLGSNSQLFQQYFTAYQQYQQALGLAQSMGSDSLEGLALKALAGNYYTRGQVEMGKEYTQKAIPVLVRAKDHHLVSVCYKNLGYMLLQSGDSTAALEAYQKALSYAQQHHTLLAEAGAYENLGEYWIKHGNPPLGIDYVSRARSIFDKLNKPVFAAEADWTMGHYYLSQKKYGQAITHLERSYRIHKHLIHSNLTDVLTPLHEAHKALGQYKNALFYVEKKLNLVERNKADRADEIRQSHEFQLKNEQQKVELSALKINDLNNQRNFIMIATTLLALLGGVLFWYNKKLITKNRELKTKNQQIGEALLKGQTTERKRVASELHDNLGGLLAALKLTTYALDTHELHPQEQGIYAQIVGMIDDANHQVRSLSHNLLPEELEKEGLISGLEMLISKLNISHKIKFSLTIEGFTKRLDKQTEFNFYTIVLELCNNIIKHSNATEASVELLQKSNELQLLVSDDGDGFDTDQLKNEGMGMKNLYERADAVGATLILRSEKGEGTIVSLKISLPALMT